MKKVVGLYIEEELIKEFKIYCTKKNFNVSAHVSKFMEREIEKK